jgi:hypothetical protein
MDPIGDKRVFCTLEFLQVDRIAHRNSQAQTGEVSGFGADADVDGCRSLSGSSVGGGEAGAHPCQIQRSLRLSTELNRSSSRDGEPFIVRGNGKASWTSSRDVQVRVVEAATRRAEVRVDRLLACRLGLLWGEVGRDVLIRHGHLRTRTSTWPSKLILTLHDLSGLSLYI